MITNIHNLPVPLVSALTPERRRPLPGRIAVTHLIDSPLRRILLMQHFDETEEDVSENLWALLGKAVHKVIEQGNKDTELKVEVPFGGMTLSGRVDFHSSGHLIDWKLTSKWSIVFASGKDWEFQLQTYKYLLEKLGHPVEKLSVYAILRDWNKREAQRNPDQPQMPFVEIKYEPWERAKIEAYIHERVSLHSEAEKVALKSTSDEIPVEFWCTPEERWHKADTYAVMKPGKKRAVRVFDTMEEAEKFAEGGGFEIDVRVGEDIRCTSYCVLSVWCPFWKEHQPKEVPDETVSV